MTGRVANRESVSTVNGKVLTRCYVRAVDGTETLVWSMQQVSEMNTNEALSTFSFATTISGATWHIPEGVTVKPDERLVIKFFVVAVGTMGAGTAVLSHDAATPSSTNDTFVTLIGSPVFKADADPDETPKVADGGLPMMGIGN
jgi:hypothetical protein